MNYEDTTPSSLLTQCRNNSNEAWEKLHTLYGRLVWHWCSRAGISHADCDEVYQEIFLSVMRSFHTFRKEKPEQKFRKWLKAVAASRIADFFRKNGKKLPTQEISEALIPARETEASLSEDEETETSLLYEQLMKILRKDFSERDIQVFIRLVTGQCVSSHDVGEEFGLSDAAVRQIKYRIKKKIAEEFEDVL